jgi:serine/threonine protein kinase
MSTNVGSVIYKAPEVMAGTYTESSDLWSLGVRCAASPWILLC